MRVVSNAGPLINLHKLGLLDLLHETYGVVVLPEEVRREVVDQGFLGGHSNALAVSLAIARGRLLVEPVQPADTTLALGALDAGERAAIQLAVHTRADLILLDERLARVEAQRLGLKCKGTIGVIVQAHHRGILDLQSVGAIFNGIKAQDDVWISDALVDAVWAELTLANRK